MKRLQTSYWIFIFSLFSHISVSNAQCTSCINVGPAQHAGALSSCSDFTNGCIDIAVKDLPACATWIYVEENSGDAFALQTCFNGTFQSTVAGSGISSCWGSQSDWSGCIDSIVYYDTSCQPIYNNSPSASHPLGITCSNPNMVFGGTYYVTIFFNASCGDVHYCFGHSCAGGDCAATLPINLTFFNASKEESAIKISWETATETNNDYFTIEKSKNATDWEIVNQVPGAGNSNYSIKYSEYDYTVLEPSILYYRLKQTDFDGNYTYSKIVSVQVNEVSDVNIYPSYTKGLINIECKSDILSIVITDMTSKQLFVGKNNKQIDLSSFPKGIYLVSVLTSSGTVVKKVVKM